MLGLGSAPSRRVAALRPHERERPSGLDRACAQTRPGNCVMADEVCSGDGAHTCYSFSEELAESLARLELRRAQHLDQVFVCGDGKM